MKTGALILAGAVLAGCCECNPVKNAAQLPVAKHDLGGVTFDFKTISNTRFAGAFDPARNVVKDGQREGHVTNAWSRVIQLPHTNGGLWRAAARYKMSHTVAGAAAFRLVPGHLQGKRFVADPVPGGAPRSFNILENGKDWADVSQAIEVPAGSDRLQVNFWWPKMCAVTFDFKDLSVTEETPKTPIVFKEMPMGNLDSAFAVGQSQVGAYEYYWRQTTDAKYNLNYFVFTLELPAGFEFVSCPSADPTTIKTEALTTGGSKVTFRIAYGRHQALTKSFNTYSTFEILVRGTGKVGTTGVAHLTTRYEEKKTKNVLFEVAAPDVKLMTIETVKCALPKRYANGVMTGRLLNHLQGEDNCAAVQSMVDAGVTWIIPGVPGKEQRKLFAEWRKMGVKYITPAAWHFNNGFQVGDPGKIPASDRYVPVKLDPNDRYAEYIKYATCPCSIYNESPFFRTNTVPFLQDFVKDTDGSWSNWEPWMFNRKGCMCDNCCRAFAKWIGKPYAEIKSTWPACVMKDGPYFEQVQKFRSIEHGKLVKTIDKYIRAASGGEKSLGFIPGIAWIEMSSWWRPRNYAAEVQAIDYAGALKWMNPWGPYAAWESNFPYVYTKRKPLCQFFAAKDIRETVDKDYPANARPKLMGLPQGYQCGHWLTQPENFALALDGFFFNRWESTIGYFYPRGYDARYWKHFAASTGRAAKYEDFVIDGTLANEQIKVTPLAGLYASNVKHLSGYLPEYNDISPLQTVAYKKDGALIVAVFNFWQKGEAFFDLKVTGLEAGTYTVLSEAGVLRAKCADQTAWCAKELAEKGVRLSVGAARCHVFEIRPAPQAIAPTSILTDAEFKKTLESRRDDLRKAAEEDAAYEKANGELVYDPMPVI